MARIVIKIAGEVNSRIVIYASNRGGDASGGVTVRQARFCGSDRILAI